MTALIISARVLFVVVFFSLCIFVHELGHLLVALWRGLFVERFSIGFGKRLWGIRHKEVDYIVSLIPFGGYVALPQLDPTEDPQTSDGTPLPNASPLSRALTAVAGPVANVIFGFFLALFVWGLGVHAPAPSTSCRVWKVPEVLPLYKDGLVESDRVVAVNDGAVSGSWTDIIHGITATEAPIQLRIEREDETLTLAYQPEPNPEFAAGLRPGDEIIAVEGQEFDGGWGELSELIVLNTDELNLTVNRDGVTRDIVYVPRPNPLADGLGYPFFDVFSPVEAERIFPESPAAKVGLKKGDLLLTVDGKRIPNAGFFVDAVKASAGAPLTLVVDRKGEQVTVKGLQAEAEDVKGETVYRIGMGLGAPTLLVHPNPWRQFVDVLGRTGRTLRSLFAPVTGGRTLVRPKHLSGPVGIIQMIMYRVTTDGIRGGLSFIVLLTFSLAIFNLLPIPILDGGHIIYSLIEMVTRRRLPKKFVYVLQTTFAVLIIGFMLYVTAFDVKRIPKFWKLSRSAEATPAPATVEKADSPPRPEPEQTGSHDKSGPDAQETRAK